MYVVGRSRNNLNASHIIQHRKWMEESHYCGDNGLPKIILLKSSLKIENNLSNLAPSIGSLAVSIYPSNPPLTIRRERCQRSWKLRLEESSCSKRNIAKDLVMHFTMRRLGKWYVINILINCSQHVIAPNPTQLMIQNKYVSLVLSSPSRFWGHTHFTYVWIFYSREHCEFITSQFINLLIFIPKYWAEAPGISKHRQRWWGWGEVCLSITLLWIA